MQSKLPDRLPAWLIVVASFFAVAAVSITFALVDDDGDGAPDRVTITVNTQPRDGAPAKTISAPAPLVEKAAEVTESDLRTTPPETPERQLERAADQRDEIRETQEPLPTAGASAGFRGCVTRFVRNQSSRNGVRPQVQVLHYTVSPNRPGWDDVNAIVALFNNPTSQASSHFVIDREGHCAHIVPIEAKAWTQAGANPVSISYEIINSGSEGSFMDSAGYTRLRSVVRQVADRTGIPLRRGATSGCTITRTGIVHHYDFGICGGGHHDINPYSIDAVVQILVAPVAKPSRLTKAEQLVAARRCELRRQVIAARKGSDQRRARLGVSRTARSAVRAQIHRIDQAKRRDHKPWSYRDRGVRRHRLAQVWTGKGCGAG